MIKRFIKCLKGNCISIIIGIVLVLAVVNTIVSIWEKRSAAKYEKAAREEAATKKALNMINTHMNLADMAFRGFYIIADQQLLHPFTDEVLVEYGPNFNSLDSLFIIQGLDRATISPVRAKVSEYMELVKTLVKMRKEEKYDEIVAILEKDPGYDVWKVYSPFIKSTTAMVEKRAQIVLEAYENLATINLYLQLLLLIFGIPSLIISFLRIHKNNLAKRKLFQTIQDNNKKYIFDPNSTSKSLDQSVIIESLIENLKKISSFVKAVTKGDYTISWEGLNDDNRHLNKENIVGDLVNMREQMKSVKVQDEQRLWVTEGISRFSEIVRKHQDNISELSFEVISNLVKYIKANQGGLFIVQEENGEKFLKLEACYAYERKKFLEKRIEFGEGLIGQAYLEKDIIYMTEIPERYVSISSGLGNANPRSVIIIPLISNDTIEAVIEIASFQKMEKHEIEFMQKVGEYVASAIAAVKVNQRTKALLQSTQEQAEEMRSQEEEMRQNMEELQATQEEVQRRTQEYQKVIETNEEEIESLKLKLLSYEPAA